MMEAVKKESVHVGNGVMIRMNTHETAGLRRIRFSPSLNMQGSRDYVFGARWHTRSGKLFRPGRYTLHLDYGLKLQELLRMAIEERQVRTIKGIIREHCPHLYQESLKSESGSDKDQVTDDLYLKGKLK
jgi:hypothetical protein